VSEFGAGVPGRPIRVLIVDDDPFVRAGLAMLLRGAEDMLVVAEGADGAEAVVLVDAPPRDILRAVRTVAAGEAMLSPAVTRRLIDRLADPAAAGRRADARERLGRLTEREREVAAAVGRGCSNAEIAAELGMGVATVKAHVSRLLAKLGLNNRVQIALLVHDAVV
jgi:DNA-binding NarL/FixJ family response regulator